MTAHRRSYLDVLRRLRNYPRERQILGFACYSHHVRVADRWRVGRVFLAGDAAHAMPPWNGQGMCAGVRDAANLCWKLTAALKDNAPESCWTLIRPSGCRT